MDADFVSHPDMDPVLADAIAQMLHKAPRSGTVQITNALRRQGFNVMAKDIALFMRARSGHRPAAFPANLPPLMRRSHENSDSGCPSNSSSRPPKTSPPTMPGPQLPQAAPQNLQPLERPIRPESYVLEVLVLGLLTLGLWVAWLFR